MSKPLVVITGASSGIGAETAKKFAAAGHPLLLLARRLEPMQALGLPNTQCEAVDVTDLPALTAAIGKAEALHGPVDCLVNNAGVMLNDFTADQDPAQWKEMFDINVLGLMNGVKAVLRKMIDREGGSIINIGSIAGIKLFPMHAAYCGTKFAVHAITEGIREEVAGKNVRVMNVAPGMTMTDLVQATTNADARQGWLDYSEKIGGALDPAVIADTILFAYQMPQSVCVRELVVCPTRQEP